MIPVDPWLDPPELISDRLVLEPMRIEHAIEMAAVGPDPRCACGRRQRTGSG
jgi:hypothetical protein